MGPFRELPGGARQQGCKAFRSGAAMMNLTGTPDIAVQVGRKASWVATREYRLSSL